MLSRQSKLLMRSRTAVSTKFARHSKKMQLIGRSYASIDSGIRWPQSKVNNVVNICPQGEQHVVERFGRFNRVVDPGLYLCLPLIDKIKYRVNLREFAVSIDPQTAISRDNVSIQISGVLYAKFVESERAAYGHNRPIYALTQHAQSTMRSAVGNMEMDELFHDRNKVNHYITDAIADAAEPWGLQVLRYEVTDIRPDRRISEAMDKQAAAERIRREKVLQATGDKESAILRSEGDLVARTNEAEAQKRELTLQAEGKAEAIMRVATAEAQALEIVGEKIATKQGQNAATLQLGGQYMQMMGEIGSKSNTMFFGQQQGDYGQMFAQLGATWQAATGALGKSQQKNTESVPPVATLTDSVVADGNTNTKSLDSKKGVLQ